MNTGRDETPAERFYREKAPLADRMRPGKIAEFLGQEHLMGADRAFRQAVEHDRIASMIFWGPPGTGKTTLGRLIARITGRPVYTQRTSGVAYAEGLEQREQLMDELLGENGNS